jgi:hypothetical protein
MRDRMADESGQGFRTSACRQGTHDKCPHIWGYGGGVNPRRLRLETVGLLCQCDCHSSCPVNSTQMVVGEQTWRESCTCPGATEAERIRRAQFPDFGELWARSGQETRSQREAFQATQAAAAAKSREEIRDLYLAELRSRGLEIPPDELIDATVDTLTGNYRTSARLFVRSVIDFWKSIRDDSRPPR